MPMGVLIGILLVMGRMSAGSEIVALRASGVSTVRLAGPALLVAVAGSMVAAYINAVHAPSARATYRGVLNDLVRNDPLRFMVPRTFIHDFPGYVLYVGDQEEGRLQNFWIWELDDQDRAIRLLRAEEGSFAFDEEQDSLLLTLKKGFTELRDASNPDDLSQLQPTLSFEGARIRLQLGDLLGSANRPRKLDHWTVPELLQARDQLLAGKEIPTDADAANLLYYISQRMAMSCSVFSLALLGIPLGIKASRSETYVNVAIALGVSLGYYVLMVIFGWLEKRPELRPEILIWLPNLGFQAVGFWLLLRVDRR